MSSIDQPAPTAGRPPSTGGNDSKPTRGPVNFLILIAVGIFALVLVVFALPPVIRSIAFLLSGDKWRALVGVSMLALIGGLALLVLVSRYDLRRLRSLVFLSWLLILLSPVCIGVALIGSGWLDGHSLTCGTMSTISFEALRRGRLV